MEAIYNNFDGLDIAFQGIASEQVLKQLADAKEIAQRQDQAHIITINDKTFSVGKTGASGGYRYCLDTGLDGENWVIGTSPDPRSWNIRVSVKSLSFALYGYKAVKKRIFDTLEALETQGAHTDLPQESIARFDYCIDFIIDDFVPSSSNIVAHSSTTKSCIEIETVERGSKIETLRVGKMPGAQLEIYNKIREISIRHKPYWWKIWGLNSTTFTQDIWRVEARAGKNEIIKWSARTFEEFETKAGDIIISILKRIKYTAPNRNDGNKARWPNHPLWLESIRIAKQALQNYTSNAKRNEILEELREIKKQQLLYLLLGNLISYTAVCGGNTTDIVNSFDVVRNEFVYISQNHPDMLCKKFNRAEEKYSLLYE